MHLAPPVRVARGVDDGLPRGFVDAKVDALEKSPKARGESASRMRATMRRAPGNEAMAFPAVPTRASRWRSSTSVIPTGSAGGGPSTFRP